ncbi:MAG: NHL repeat-containing protein, partial [Ardenticatenales bacterium]
MTLQRIAPSDASVLSVRNLCRRIAIGGATALVLLLGTAFVAPQAAAPAAAQGGLIAYHKVDQWPQRTSASQGLFQTPSDLDVSKDGRVFIADPGIGGVHTLLPNGTFATPFGVTGGFPAQLGQVGPIAIGPDPTDPAFPSGAQRIYIVDPAIDRVAFYDLGGTYQGQWSGIKGQGIAADGAGTVYVLDRETGQVRAFDAVSGAQRWAWGVRGTDDGQLTSFTDISVTPDGAVIAIGDKRGQRVQLFDVAAQADVDGGAQPLAFRRSYDLRNAKFTSQDSTCNGDRVNALGGDQVFIGQGDGACLVDARTVAFAIAASASKSTICRPTVLLPTLRADTQQYFALAKSDPNPGKCGAKQGAKLLVPVVVSYSDNALRQVATVFPAASNDDSKTPVLFSPETLSMSDADTIFIADSSSKFRFYSTAGEQVATSARDTQQGSFGGDFEFFRIQAAVAADTLGEVIGYYINGKRSGSSFSAKTGIGRFRTIEKRGQNGTDEIIEPVWTDEIQSQNGFRGISVPSIAFNPVTKEVLVLRVETVPQQRTTDVQIARYAPDGRKLNPAWDVPDDGSSNPYADMVVGPDGRVYVLDDINDVVRVLESDGTPVRDIPVAFDARAVAAGPESPDGAVFVLREPGSIERYADDGRVTARLDGRPLSFSDPTTLTDLVVDGAGRVYVADGQTSLITVLEPSDTPDDIPIPDDGKCLYNGKASVDPAVLNVGESTTVHLELNGRCGTDEDPTDIVVVVPYYRQLAQGTDPSASTISDMMRLMARVNF